MVIINQTITDLDPNPNALSDSDVYALKQENGLVSYKGQHGALRAHLNSVGVVNVTNANPFPNPLVTNTHYKISEPYGIYSWLQINGTAPNNITDLSILSTLADGSNIYAGTSTAGIFKSIDDGKNWTAINTGFTESDCTVLFSDGTDIYAGSGNGLFKSTDDGDNWVAINTGLTKLSIQSLFVDGSNLYVTANDGGVFVSTDSGANWSDISVPAITNPVTGLDKDFSKLIVCINGDGVYESTDSGSSWSPRNTGLLNLNVTGISVFLDTSYVSTGFGVFKSIDGLGGWTTKNTGITNLDCNFISDNGGNLYVGTSTGIFKSTDGGILWSEFNNNLTSLGTTAFSFSVNSIYVATSNGIFSGVDKTYNWEEKNNGITGTNTSRIIIVGATLYVSSFNGGVHRSTDQAENWTTINNGLSNTTCRDLTFDETGIYVCNNDGIFKSTDGGDNWADSSTGLPADLVTVLFTSEQGDLFAGINSSTGGVFKSTDNGANWVDSSVGFPGGNAVADIKGSGSVLYVSLFSAGGIVRSRDQGATWVVINNGLTGLDIDYLSSNRDFIFCSENGSTFFRSIDEGDNWERINNGNPSGAARVIQSDGATVYAGIDGHGFFKSTDNGENWVKIVKGLPSKGSVSPRGFLIDRGKIYGIANALGVFRADLPLNELHIPPGAVIKISSDSVVNNYLLTGNGATLFRSSGLVFLEIDSVNFVNGGVNNRLHDLTGVSPAFSNFFAQNSRYIGFDNLGDIKNILYENRVCSTINYKKPLLANGCNGFYGNGIVINIFPTISITSITLSGTTATVTTSGEHGFVTAFSILHSGAVEVEYNITAKVSVTSPTTYEYQVLGSPSSPATGIIKSKIVAEKFGELYDTTSQQFLRWGVANNFLPLNPGESLFDLRPKSNTQGLNFGNNSATAGGKYLFTDKTGVITLFADAGGGLVRATSTAHGLITGEELLITGQNAYHAGHIIDADTSNTFTFPATFDSNSGNDGEWSTGSVTSNEKLVIMTGNEGQPSAKTICDAYITSTLVIPASTPGVTTKLRGTWTTDTLVRMSFQSSTGDGTGGTIDAAFCEVDEQTETDAFILHEAKIDFSKTGSATNISFFFILDGVESTTRKSEIISVTEGSLLIKQYVLGNKGSKVELGVSILNGDLFNINAAYWITSK